MKSERILYALGDVREEFINEAAPHPETAKKFSKKRAWIRWGAMAACLAIILGGIFWAKQDQAYIKPERNIVETFGYIEPMGDMIADVNNFEAVTELSSQIVLCKVNKLLDVTITETNLFSFRYEIEILDILFDVDEKLQIGDMVEITSSEGILKATEAAALIGNTPRAQKLGILQGEYSEDDYIISSTWNAIPIEAGNCYLMYLDDDHLESEGVYAESGRSYLYEYHGQTVYSGRDMVRSELDLSEIMETVKGYISMRTGRADEIGDTAYMIELGEQQSGKDDSSDCDR